MTMIVAGSSSGVNGYSSDGITWTPGVGIGGNPAATPYGMNVKGLASMNGVMVAVGNGATSGTMIFTSPDGLTWTPRTNPAGWSGTSITGVTASPELGLFIAFGASGQVATSPDGINWTLRTTPVAADINDVCWAKELGLFVANVNTATVVLTSPDGINWTTRTGVGTGIRTPIQWNGSILVSAGQSGQVSTSPDGINWTARSAPGGTTSALNSLEWCPASNLWVTVSTFPAIYTNPSPHLDTSWTTRTNPGSFSGTGNRALRWIKGANSGAGLLIYGTDLGRVLTSPDGITWTIRTPVTGNTNYNVLSVAELAAGGTVFAAFGIPL